MATAHLKNSAAGISIPAPDTVDKFREYAAGVPEYWIPDPHELATGFFQLDAPGIYREAAPEDGTCTSPAVAGLWLKVAWLSERPKLSAVLREWGLI